MAEKKRDKRKLKRVCILGSGNSGTALAKVVAANCARLSTFQDEVTMYVYEEVIDGRKLTELINETHENVKYLPGRSLGSVVAVADLVAAARDADIIVFALPHRYVRTVCAALLGKVKPGVVGVVMIKGVDVTEAGAMELPSRTIASLIRIPTCVLTGIMFPSEMVAGKLCETSVGCKSKATSALLADVLQSDVLRTLFVDELDTVEVCATLRTIVGCAAGVMDGLDQGYNCKASIFRLGLIETVKFLDMFYPNVKLASVFESSSVADLLLSCYYGRDRRVTEAFVRSHKSLAEVEQELLNGGRLDGARVAREVYGFLRPREYDEVFPLFSAVHLVLAGELKPELFLAAIRSHPEHNLRLQRLGW